MFMGKANVIQQNSLVILYLIPLILPLVITIIYISSFFLFQKRENYGYISDLILFTSVSLSILIFTLFKGETITFQVISTSVIISVILLSLVKIFDYKLNLFLVPFISFVLIEILLQTLNDILIYNFITGIFLSFFISVISLKFEFLTEKGSYAVFFLAAIIFGLGGWKWTVPIVVFFVLSSLLSKLKKKVNSEIEETGKTIRRNHIQVFANGGLGGVLIIINHFFPDELFYIMYVSSVAAVCADTWSTETGTLIKTTTVDILTLEKVRQGVNGGISLIGTLGGIIGSALIAASSVFWIGLKNIQYLLFIILAGVLGNIVDSIFGSSFQPKYKCSVCSGYTEQEIHCKRSTSFVSGFRWVNNDFVNFASGLAGSLFGLFFIEIF